jgi:hypothetical protein
MCAALALGWRVSDFPAAGRRFVCCREPVALGCQSRATVSLMGQLRRLPSSEAREAQAVTSAGMTAFRSSVVSRLSPGS